MLAIQADRLFDGMQSSPLRRPTVVIEDGRILRIVEGRATDAAAAKQISLGNVTLLPGMIDCHQHLVFDASDDPVGHLADRDDNDVLEAARAAARTALRAGITTVRDLGDRNFILRELKAEFARDTAAGPELLMSGPPITRKGGHCWFLGGEVNSRSEAVRAVRLSAERGADVIKVMITGGALTVGSANGELQFSSAELAAIASEAHDLGLTVTGHVKCARGMFEAVNAGFDGIEHGIFLTPLPDQAAIDAIAAAGIYVSDTAAFKPPLPPTRDRWEKENSFAAMWAAGINLVLTSDAGINPSAPHDALAHGAAGLARIGMTNTEALRSVTSSAASVCGLGHRKGRLAPGYDADLIAVDGNPLEDLAALPRVAAVFRGGVRVR